MQYVDLRRHIGRLCNQHGGFRSMCRALELDPGYVHRLHSGEKINPSDETLEKLGLERVVRYKRRGNGHGL